jgi:hypothetical protein
MSTSAFLGISTMDGVTLSTIRQKYAFIKRMFIDQLENYFEFLGWVKTNKRE